MSTRLPLVPFLAAAASAIVAPAAAQDPAFELTELPELAGASSALGDGGLFFAPDSGGVSQPAAAGWSTDSSGVREAVVWSVPTGQPPEPVVPLASLDPSVDSWANGGMFDSAASATEILGASTSSQRLVLPVMWSRTATGGSFGAPVPLPTLAGGEGEAVAGHPHPCFIVGVSADPSGVDKAVAWTDESQGLVVTQLPDLGQGLAARATTAALLSAPQPCFLAGGWAVDAAGDTIPQSWDLITGGTWNRVSLPLLQDGTEGWVSDLDVTGSTLRFAGRASTTTGEHHAAEWESVDGGQTWTVTDLGTLAGTTESQAESVTHDLQGVVILCGHAHDANGARTATLWTDGANPALHDLSDLVVGGGTLVPESAKTTGIDEDGGVIIFGDGTHVATVHGQAGPHAWVARQVGATRGEVGVEPPAGLEATVAPNPFSRTTTISFSLPSPASVRLTVHDVAGRRVAVLAEGEYPAGPGSATWTGRDRNGAPLSPGVYLVRLQAAGRTAIEKVVRVE